MKKISYSTTAIFVGIIILLIFVAIVFLVYNSSSKTGDSNEEYGSKKEKKVSFSETPEIHTKVEERSEDEKPTLVFFYADWCGYCKSMLVEWEKVKQEMKKLPQFVVLEFENSKNPEEISSNKIQGFPTLRMYPGGYKKNPKTYVNYSGERTFQGIMDFVTKGPQNK